MADQLIDRYEGRGVRQGGELYLSLEEGKRFIEECSHKRVAVLGIDFVHIQEDSVHPHIPVNSADWSLLLQAVSWTEAVIRCNAASLKVLEREEKEDPHQFCSFVLFREEEWVGSERDQQDRRQENGSHSVLTGDHRGK